MPLNDLNYISKQFIMKKMGFEQDEIVENERLWMQENPDAVQSTGGDSAPGADAGLQSVGIESPDSPEADLGIDEDGNLEGADSEFENQNGGNSGFDPNSLGNSF